MGTKKMRQRRGPAAAKPSPPQPPPSAQPPGPRPRFPAWAHGVWILALVVASVALYWGTFDLGFFNLDDPDYIQKNPYLSPINGSNLAHILTTPYFANYAPGHLLSYMADIALAGGKSAMVMHVSSALWYACVVGLVYLMAFKILGRPAAAVASAVLFMVHPAHVEVVAWLSSRKDLVATAFAVLSMLCYLCYRERERKRPWWYVGSLFCFLAANSAKQSAILLPMVFLAWDAFVEKRRDWRMIWDKVPYALIAVYFGLMAWGAQPSTRTAPDLYVLSRTELANLWLLIGLADSVMYRPRPDPASVSFFVRLGVIAAAGLLWLAPLALQRWRRATSAALCCWVLISMLPPMTLSFLTPVTDRYLFLPSVGFCILACASVAHWHALEKKWQVTCWVAVALIALAWCWKTLDYVREWRDPRSVWFFAATKVKSSPAYEYCGGVFHDAAERLQEFIRTGKGPLGSSDVRLAEVVTADPARLARLQTEWNGAAASRTNSITYRDELRSLAWSQYEQAVARRGTRNTPNLFIRRGMILIDRGQHQEAVKEFGIGLDLARTHTYKQTRDETTVHLQRATGIAYWNMNSYAEARDWLLKAQATQQGSGVKYVPTLDAEVEQITKLAATQK